MIRAKEPKENSLCKKRSKERTEESLIDRKKK